jgi:hypothetical protein
VGSAAAHGHAHGMTLLHLTLARHGLSQEGTFLCCALPLPLFLPPRNQTLLMCCPLMLLFVCWIVGLLCMQPIDTSTFDWLAFNMPPAEQQRLLLAGMEAAQTFLMSK